MTQKHRKVSMQVAMVSKDTDFEKNLELAKGNSCSDPSALSSLLTEKQKSSILEDLANYLERVGDILNFPSLKGCLLSYGICICMPNGICSIGFLQLFCFLLDTQQAFSAFLFVWLTVSSDLTTVIPTFITSRMLSMLL